MHDDGDDDGELHSKPGPESPSPGHHGRPDRPGVAPRTRRPSPRRLAPAGYWSRPEPPKPPRRACGRGECRGARGVHGGVRVVHHAGRALSPFGLQLPKWNSPVIV